MIEIETRTQSKGQNVTVLYMYLRIFSPSPPPLQNTDLIKAYKMDILWCLVLKKVKIWAYQEKFFKIILFLLKSSNFQHANVFL